MENRWKLIVGGAALAGVAAGGVIGAAADDYVSLNDARPAIALAADDAAPGDDAPFQLGDLSPESADSPDESVEDSLDASSLDSVDDSPDDSWSDPSPESVDSANESLFDSPDASSLDSVDDSPDVAPAPAPTVQLGSFDSPGSIDSSVSVASWSADSLDSD